MHASTVDALATPLANPPLALEELVETTPKNLQLYSTLLPLYSVLAELELVVVLVLVQLLELLA